MSETLDELRAEINKIDSEIIDLLTKRFSLMPKIAEEKKKSGKDICDERRELEIIEKRYQMLKNNGIDDIEFVRDLFKLIMTKSKKIQKDGI